MRIVDIHGTTPDEIAARRWNPYLGISIRNRAFTPEAIAAFTRWGVAHAHEKFALLIVDVIQRVNNEVFDRANPAKALEKAFAQADAVRGHCRAAVEALPPEDRAKVVIVEWPDIIDDTYAANRRLVFEAFEASPEFRDYILRSVSKNLGAIVERLKDGELETLCQYVLYEIPEFMRGFVAGDTHFNLCVYPGGITFLTRDLLAQDFFKPLYARMRSYGPVAHAEMYVAEDSPSA